MITIYPKYLNKLPEINPNDGYEGCCEIDDYNEIINFHTGFAGIEGVEYWLDELTNKGYLDTLRYRALGYPWLEDQRNDEVLSDGFGDEWNWEVEYNWQHDCLVFTMWQDDPY